jgi:type III secretion protein N (ATPase)
MRQANTHTAHAALPRLAHTVDSALAAAAGRITVGLSQRGKVTQAVGTLVRAVGVHARVGELCRLIADDGRSEMMAEVVGFDGGAMLLSPLGPLDGLSGRTRVAPTGRCHEIAVGDFVLGRVINGTGTAFLDEGPALPSDAELRPVQPEAPAPLERPPIECAMDTGVRSIDALLTLGEGQRLGVFAPAGCGKSTLLGMMCRNASVDVIVVGLVGERGREVSEFIQDAIGPSARARSVVVVATSDRPPTERLKAALVATTYAEYFRERGSRVLLLVDSVTRVARAAREIGLAAGEPPTRRGFPPSVFTMLPRLFERAGRTRDGSITAVYSVLEEDGDGQGNDPISQEVRSLLDGHVVLSRKLAGRGHFPAIDILGSTSRLIGRVASAQDLSLARKVRDLLAKYEDVELLLSIGEYQRGVDLTADRAIDLRPSLESFLAQQLDEPVTRAAAMAQLAEVLQ